MTPTLDLACDLISRHSVTPQDEGCQALMMERLAAVGFCNESLRFDDTDQASAWALTLPQPPKLAAALILPAELPVLLLLLRCQPQR